MGIVELLVSTLVPTILSQVTSSINSGEGSKKDHEWIASMVNGIVSELDQYIPDFIKPSEEEIKGLIVQAIEAALSKLE